MLLASAVGLVALALRGYANLADRARTHRDDAALTAILQEAERLNDLRKLMKPDPFTPAPSRPTAAADNAMWGAEWSRLRGESNVRQWEEAATAWDMLERPLRAAYARWRWAEALLAKPNGRASAASVLRAAARDAAQHVPLSTAIRDLARRARIDLNESAESVERDEPAEPTGALGLTDRELAVLRLLGEGKTNTEIGAALFISRSTASVHVTNILRKLGVTSRVQAATIAGTAGLFAADSEEPTS
jgi:DNA-binding CsgD family transcriptional regulator